MDATVVAVTGTLLAGLLGAVLPNLLNDRLTRREQRRQDLATAVKAVLAGATWMRNKQYRKHVARQSGGEGDSEQARGERYDAQSTLNDGLDALYLTTGDRSLLDAAQAVFDTCVALGDADSGDGAAIAAAGLAARKAHTRLRVTAAGILYP